MAGAESEPQQARETPKKHRHIFTVGSSVEVLTEEPDYGGVFFEATVVKSPPSLKKSSKNNPKNKLYVEYRGLVVEEGGSVPLREYVDVSMVRPEPPPSVGSFEVGELVDAFYNDGWWTGVVTRVIEGGGGSPRLIVTFPHPPDVREFDVSDLRHHLKWVDGTWIAPKKQDVLVRSSGDGVHLHDHALNISENMALPFMSDRSETLTHFNQKNSHLTNSGTKRRHPSEQQVVSLPLEKLKEGDVFGARPLVTIDRAFTAMVSDIRTEYQLSNNLSLWKPIRKKRSNAGEAQTANGMINFASEKGESVMQPLGIEVVIGGRNAPSQGVENKLARNESKQSVIVGLPVADMVSSASRKSSVKKARGSASGSIEINSLLSDKEHQFSNSTTSKKKDGRSLKTDSVKFRRKGRPRKYLLDGNQSPMTGNSQNGDTNPKSVDKDGAPHCVPEKPVIEKDDMLSNQEKMALDKDKFAENQSGPGCNRQQSSERIPAERDDESFDEEAVLATFMRKRPIRSLQNSSKVHDDPKAHGEHTNGKNDDAEAERVVTREPDLEFRDGPLTLSKCIKEVSSPPITHNKSLSLENPKNEKCMENDKTQRDGELLQEMDKLKNNQQPSASANVASFVPSDEAGIELPFVKTNNLWKTIESMEAFQRIPQRPHFRPLEKLAERTRQGLAIGLMVTCASVMEEAENLRLSDPKSITDSILETLTELETHGFNVKVVKDRVNDFVAMKEKRSDKIEELKRLNDQILEREGKKRRNIEEADEIKKQIHKLQERLTLVASEDAKADEEMACLRASARETEADINIAEHDFEALVSW